MNLNSDQKFGFKKLEFLTYKNEFCMGLEHIIPGNADRIYHGPVPVIITFKETQEYVIKP